MVSLLPVEIKLKAALTFRNYWMPILLSALIKILGHYKLDFLEAKGNHLTDISI